MSDNTAVLLQLDEQRKKVDVDQFDLTLREIKRMVREKELHRAPVYQRKFRWGEDVESRLIESLFLGLPVPNIFVAANADGTWELVDGLQRVSTVLHFLAASPASLKALRRKEPLRLSGLSKLSEMNGRTFKELPTTLQLSFYKRGFRVTALSDKSDPDVRFDMFDRLNRGGVALTPQEIRACVFAGTLSAFLKEMASLPSFQSLLKLTKAKQEDGTKEEMVLRFFAYLEKRDAFSNSVKDFLNSYMKDHRNSFNKSDGSKLFKAVTETLAAIVGGPVLRDGSKTTPLAELEAVLVACGELVKAGEVVGTPPPNWLDDSELVRCSKAGTNSRSMLNGRITRARELLSVSNGEQSATKK